MKLNLDCMRDVLLEMEKIPYGGALRPKAIHSTLSKYSTYDIDYSILKLHEANFISAVISDSDNGIVILRLDDITYEGHQFLANIRSPSVWEKVKDSCAKVGTFSIPYIIEIASQIFTTNITNLIS